jgi:hypothetical protein
MHHPNGTAVRGRKYRERRHKNEARLRLFAKWTDVVCVVDLIERESVEGITRFPPSGGVMREEVARYEQPGSASDPAFQ